MVAPVTQWTDDVPNISSTPSPFPIAAQAVAPQKHGPGLKWRLLWAGSAVVLLLLVAAILIRERMVDRRQSTIATVAQPQKSVAVLPFLDLTQGMQNEEFADGMTEELIDKLSKVSGLRVPSATSSFYFKNKRVPLGDIAKNLGVAYVLDGSVRKSGQRLRVAARLVRVDNGYVMWSETYDRPLDDLLMVQDDIAGDVTKALTQSIEGQQ
jgi:TolB-like protein